MPKTSASAPSGKAAVVNLPNALTLFRLLLVPVFVWLMFVDGAPWRWLALVVFVVASITDHLDGRIARSRGLITEFGMLADPIADKALTLGAFIGFSWQGALPWWFTVLVGVRELGITLLREVLRRQGKVIPAGRGGKLKTGLQITLIIWLLVPWSGLLAFLLPDAWVLGGRTGVDLMAWILIVVTVVQTWASAVPYLVNVWKWQQKRG